MMPKKQSTAAQIARAVQKTTGQKYTAALRGAEAPDPIRALGAALHRAGLTKDAQYMDSMAVWQDETDRLWSIVSEAEEAYKEPASPLSSSELRERRRAYLQADVALRVHCEGVTFHEGEELLLCVFRALKHAAVRPDAGWLAAAAGDALCTVDFEFGADVVRHLCLDASGLRSPGTASAVLARAAARAMAAASMLPTRNKEQWGACVDLLRTAVDLAEAAGAA